MNWLSLTLSWYVVLFIIGIVFVPLTRVLLGKYFFDRAYPFAKTIGIILMSYGIFVLGIMHIARFTWDSLVFLLFGFAAVNGYIFLHLKQKVSKFQLLKDKRSFVFIIFEELLFITALVCYMFVRGQEPAIRSLEKFMDYGFMNSILRTEFFPPLDMWLSADPKEPGGYFINYYYFGHLSGSMLIKLSQVPASFGYNLILGTIFAQGITLAFSFCANLIFNIKRQLVGDSGISKIRLGLYGLLGSFFINLGGNLHAIYAFTKGYNPDVPEPFWKIMLSIPEMFDKARPSTYWYPNATRFIPKTIHEFPSYSYVVADLHGHVFDIPFVFVTLALLLTLFLFGIQYRKSLPLKAKPKKTSVKDSLGTVILQKLHTFSHEFITTLGIHVTDGAVKFKPRFDTLMVALLGFMTAIHYMTNALNGPIYFLLSLSILFLLFGFTTRFFSYFILLVSTFALFSYPFSANFAPFASSIGVNCSPTFLTDLEKIGPFIFEKGNCQVSEWWMLFILWGFFFIGFILLLISLWSSNRVEKGAIAVRLFHKEIQLHAIDLFILILYGYGFFLITVPEFFYAKDIYPDHFRANTMFKLGYQAFIIMNIALIGTLFRIRLMKSLWRYVLIGVYLCCAFFVIIYPTFAFPSYYPGLYTWDTYKKDAKMDGIHWLDIEYPENREIVEYFEQNVKGQPVILEAQGDSYTDYNHISAYTGLPTVAGWWVHEWLWRGSASVVGDRIPDIETIYNTEDQVTALRLLQKYNVSYVIVGKQERTKYPDLQEEKFSQIATRVFKSKNGVGSIYKLDR